MSESSKGSKVLVLWIESKTSSIIDESEIRIKKNRKGEEIGVQGKWDGKWYDVKIITRNGKLF